MPKLKSKNENARRTSKADSLLEKILKALATITTAPEMKIKIFPRVNLGNFLIELKIVAIKSKPHTNKIILDAI